MGKLNTVCKTCGSQYYHCFACPSDLQHPSWRKNFDNENCKEIFNILCRHGQNMVSDDEAKELLNHTDLTNKETFVENIKNHINQIYSENTNAVTEVLKTEVETVVTDVVEEQNDTKATRMSFKNKKKKKNSKN